MNSIQNTQHPFYYVDKKGIVQKDQNTGYFGYLTRCVTTLWRDYNLFNVNKAMHKDGNEKSLLPEERSEIDAKIVKKCSITPDEYIHLKKISGAFSSKRFSQDNCSFLKKIKGNNTFNTNIGRLINQAGTIEGITGTTLEKIRTYSYKTGMEKQFIAVLNKAQNLWNEYDKNSSNPTEITENAKLTLTEVRVLESLSKMKPFLGEFNEQTRTALEITSLYEASEKSEALINKILERCEKEEGQTTGSFIVYDLKTDYALRGQKINWKLNMIHDYILKTNIEHVSVVYKNGKNQDIEAHMWGSPVSKFNKGRRTLSNHCFKTIQMTPSSLLDPENKRKMLELYGLDWENKLLKKYTDISRNQYEKNQELEKLTNPVGRRLLAVIGLRFGFFKRPWEEQCEFSPEKEVICSEFAILSSLQCLKKLNEKIKEEWEGKGKTGTPPKLNPPVRENRKLNCVLPGEMIQRLFDQKSAKLIDQPPCIKAMIQLNNEELTINGRPLKAS